MRRSSFLIALVLALSVRQALAQSDASGRQPDAVSVIVPVVGTVQGVGDVRWKTDLELFNESSQEVTVAISLATVPDLLPVITTVPPRQSVVFPDVVGETFGLDATLSPVLVQTLARRSVSIRATAYGIRGTEVTQPQPIAINYASGYYPLRVLHGLSFSDDYRTNIGLVNLSEREAVFVLGLQRLAGRNLAVTRVAVPPLTLWHLSVQALFPLLNRGSDFTVIVESSDPQTHVYGSVIDNSTSNARFIQPTIAAQVIQTQAAADRRQ
ncbi:MAG TPA: hypothetical protein VFL80_12930 [Thermoanaerobaculia bacterium]|nr:hypothetical protein [Thermoanaerobaculia bacterium]